MAGSFYAFSFYFFQENRKAQKFCFSPEPYQETDWLCAMSYSFSAVTLQISPSIQISPSLFPEKQSQQDTYIHTHTHTDMYHILFYYLLSYFIICSIYKYILYISYIYSWPLKNMGLNYMGSLIGKVFSINTVHCCKCVISFLWLS